MPPAPTHTTVNAIPSKTTLAAGDVGVGVGEGSSFALVAGVLGLVTLMAVTGLFVLSYGLGRVNSGTAAGKGSSGSSEDYGSVNGNDSDSSNGSESNSDSGNGDSDDNSEAELPWDSSSDDSGNGNGSDEGSDEGSDNNYVDSGDSDDDSDSDNESESGSDGESEDDFSDSDEEEVEEELTSGDRDDGDDDPPPPSSDIDDLPLPFDKLPLSFDLNWLINWFAALTITHALSAVFDWEPMTGLRAFAQVFVACRRPVVEVVMAEETLVLATNGNGTSLVITLAPVLALAPALAPIVVEIVDSVGDVDASLNVVLNMDTISEVLPEPESVNVTPVPEVPATATSTTTTTFVIEPEAGSTPACEPLRQVLMFIAGWGITLKFVLGLRFRRARMTDVSHSPLLDDGDDGLYLHIPLPESDDLDLLPSLPPGDDLDLIPPLPAGNDLDLLPPLPPGDDLDLLPPLPPGDDLVLLPPLPPGDDLDLLPSLPPGDDLGLLPPLPPGDDLELLPPLPSGDDLDLLPPLPDIDDSDLIVPPAPPLVPIPSVQIFVPNVSMVEVKVETDEDEEATVELAPVAESDLDMDMDSGASLPNAEPAVEPAPAPVSASIMIQPPKSVLNPYVAPFKPTPRVAPVQAKLKLNPAADAFTPTTVPKVVRPKPVVVNDTPPPTHQHHFTPATDLVGMRVPLFVPMPVPQPGYAYAPMGPQVTPCPVRITRPKDVGEGEAGPSMSFEERAAKIQLEKKLKWRVDKVDKRIAAITGQEPKARDRVLPTIVKRQAVPTEEEMVAHKREKRRLNLAPVYCRALFRQLVGHSEVDGAEVEPGKPGVRREAGESAETHAEGAREEEEGEKIGKGACDKNEEEVGVGFCVIKKR
ncbi:hypothetical protein DXG01_007017 [Tephrocybe rancida]|nr:hypothetical protein DXG01_007017 [Tephrocybe rancida]